MAGCIDCKYNKCKLDNMLEMGNEMLKHLKDKNL